MRGKNDRIVASIMLLPSVILILIFVYGFILQTIRTSMTDWGENVDNPAMALEVEKNYVGLDNYQELMTQPMQFDFRTSMVNTFFFTLLFVGGCVIMGFVLALLLDMNVKFEGVFRTIFLFPMSLSLVVTGTIWRWLLQPEGLNALPNRLFGFEPYTFNWLSSRKLVLNFDWGEAPMYLTYLGLFILAILAFNYFIKERWGALTFVSAIGGIMLFLYAVGFWENTIWPQLGGTNRDGEFIPMAEPKGYQVALSGIVVAAIWQMAGYTMAMFLAGIRGIPEELREAARVDGCSEFGVYWRVVLPQLTPVAVSAVIVLGHISLKIFDLVFAMTGRQNFQTIVPGIMVYGAFDTNRYATASAIAVIMLVLVSIVIVPYLWTQLKNREA